MKLISFRFLSLAILLTLLAPIVTPAVAQTNAPAAAPAQVAAPAPAAPLRNDPLHIFSQSIQTLTATVTKSVVQIVATGYGLSSEKEPSNTALFELQEAIGAGVILTSDGYIVTNAHVVQGARKIRVRLPGLEAPGPDETLPHGPMSARLVGIDRQSDLAVLKIDTTNLPALELADSDQLKQGQVVFAFGSPQGLENSVTMGVISATARQVSEDNPTTYVQTDAPINPGNSGGPLVDVDGHGWSASIPLSSRSPAAAKDWASPFPAMSCEISMSNSRAEGHVHRGQIGVYLRTITPDLAEGLKLPRSHGVLLEDVSRRDHPLKRPA